MSVDAFYMMNLHHDVAGEQYSVLGSQRRGAVDGA